MKILTTKVAAILLMVPYLMNGLMHLMKTDDYAMMLKGWSGANALVIFSGLAMLAGVTAVLVGSFSPKFQKLASWAALGLALETLIIVVLLHIPGAGGEDPMMKRLSISFLLKDLGLVGGTLLLSGYFWMMAEGEGS